MTKSNLFKDADFSDGLLYVYSHKDPEGGKVLFPGVLFPNVVANPFYRITHWWTQHPVTDFEHKTMGDQSRSISADAMNVMIEPTERGNAITLDLLATKEYGGRVRADGEGFPHLLLECFFNDSPAIGDLQSLDLNFDVMIEKCENHMKEEDYDPNLHCAHTSAIFAIENANVQSASYKQYFWFIVPVFDSRCEIPAGGEMQDGGDESQEKIGTGMYIYGLDGALFWTKSVYDGQWHSFSHDILPYIRNAFASVQKHGFLKDATEKDLKFKSFNFGWEITGNFDAAMKIRNLSGEYR